MATAVTFNPLLSNQKSSQLQTVLHPLVLLAISDCITRHTLREQQGPIVGGLLGLQNGREVTIEHTFECHTLAAPDVEGGYLLDIPRFTARLEQMVTVHKERRLELVGWYTLLPASGPTPANVPVHTQILEGFNESAILLGFHPCEALSHSVGGKLPLTIYESSYEVDDAKNDQDGEDKKMDDGECASKLKFRSVPYTVETDETEMICMNYVASGGSATSAAPKDERPSRSIESTSKGKRRLLDGEFQGSSRSSQSETDDNLTREEEEVVASLTTKANAIKMLHSRIRLITTYLDRLPPSFINGEGSDADRMETDTTTTNTIPSFTILRQIQALVSRLNLVIPSDEEAFDGETLQQCNDVDLLVLLNSVMQSLTQAKDLGRKSSAIEATRSLDRRLAADVLAGGGLYNMPASGDLFM